MTTAKLACPCNRTWFGHSPATQHDDTARRVALRCAQPTMKRPSTVSAASEVVIAQHAEVVIAHCSMDLAWLRHGLGRLGAQGTILVRRVSVYSKCGKPVINASADWEVHELPNVGRNDHTYAHHIATSHGCLQPTVFFFKDRQAAGWSQMKDRVVPLEAMAQLVLSTGFACGFRASNKDYAAFHRAVPEFHMSSYRTSSHNQLAARHSGEVPCTDWADHRMGDESEWLTPDGAEHLGYLLVAWPWTTARNGGTERTSGFLRRLARFDTGSTAQACPRSRQMTSSGGRCGRCALEAALRRDEPRSCGGLTRCGGG